MSLREKIDAADDKLTASDRELVQALLASPGEGAFCSAGEIAKQAGVHPATAVRLARKLGFSGYPELRAKLQADFVSDNGAARIQERLAKANDGSILETLIESEIAALQSVSSYVTQDDIRASTNLLINATQITVFGIGHAASLADLFARRLSRSGYAAQALSNPGWEAPEELMRLAGGGVLILIAFRSLPDGVEDMMQYVRGVGGRILVISDLMGTFMKPKPDALLAASRGVDGDSQSLTVPMALCNTLILEMSKNDGGRSLDSLENLTLAREAMGLKKQRRRKTPKAMNDRSQPRHDSENTLTQED